MFFTFTLQSKSSNEVPPTCPAPRHRIHVANPLILVLRRHGGVTRTASCCICSGHICRKSQTWLTFIAAWPRWEIEELLDIVGIAACNNLLLHTKRFGSFSASACCKLMSACNCCSSACIEVSCCSSVAAALAAVSCTR